MEESVYATNARFSERAGLDPFLICVPEGDLLRSSMGTAANYPLHSFTFVAQPGPRFHKKSGGGGGEVGVDWEGRRKYGYDTPPHLSIFKTWVERITRYEKETCKHIRRICVQLTTPS